MKLFRSKAQFSAADLRVSEGFSTLMGKMPEKLAEVPDALVQFRGDLIALATDARQTVPWQQFGVKCQDKLTAQFMAENANAPYVAAWMFIMKQVAAELFGQAPTNTGAGAVRLVLPILVNLLPAPSECDKDNPVAAAGHTS